MRRPRLRLTTRRMMALVALAALAIGGAAWGRTMARRRAFCLDRAANSSDEERLLLGHVGMLESDNYWGGCIVWDEPPPGKDVHTYCQELARGVRAEAGAWDRIAREYREIADHPWRPVPERLQGRPHP